ncbi:MAG TPA: hypothetical protein VFE15_03680 [Marmoricola sp.]|jgi:hypothetical protein|nr:hypothetical protein [Marmoricola sp.]
MQQTRAFTERSIAIAGLCLAVAMIHVTDQGGFKAMDDPDWLGWAYRALEVGGALVALVILFDAVSTRLTGLLLLGLGAGPFVGYILTRTTGLPHDSGDKGNWNDPLGTMALIVEGALILIGLMLAARAGERPGATGSMTAGRTPAHAAS